jgi:predicted nucleic acid-binding protein
MIDTNVIISALLKQGSVPDVVLEIPQIITPSVYKEQYID